MHINLKLLIKWRYVRFIHICHVEKFAEMRSDEHQKNWCMASPSKDPQLWIVLPTGHSLTPSEAKPQSTTGWISIWSLPDVKLGSASIQGAMNSDACTTLPEFQCTVATVMITRRRRRRRSKVSGRKWVASCSYFHARSTFHDFFTFQLEFGWNFSLVISLWLQYWGDNILEMATNASETEQLLMAGASLP